MTYRISKFALMIIANYEIRPQLGISLKLLHGDETWSASKVAYER
jgi:hypothetical protein